MFQLPIGVGNAEAQRQFLTENEAFLREYSNIYALLQKVVVRKLVPPSDEQINSMDDLPDSHPIVVAIEDKWLADRVVFYLGRIAADDFSELLILSGNGYGIGALKVLRGMYERIVTAAYMMKNPSGARAFAEDDAIKRWKLWRQLIEAAPELKSRYAQEQVQGLEVEYNEANAKRKSSVCSRCGQPITQDAWTRLDLATMAKQVDAKLSSLYAPCYLEPTFHSHATAYGLRRRMRHADGVFSFKETSKDEARMAVLLGHSLILQLLDLQNDYFALNLRAEIDERREMFQKIWDKG